MIITTNSNKKVCSEIIDVTGDNGNDLSPLNEIDRSERISYTELHNTASELCRLVSTDQGATRITYVTLKEWIDKIRHNEKFELVFQQNDLALGKNSIMQQNNMPLSSTVSTTNSLRIGKRYKSFRERNISVFQKSNTNHDELHLKPQRKKPKHNTCGLCDMPQCAKWTCQKLKAYRVTILPKDNLQARINFCNKLIVPEELNPDKRSVEDVRMVYVSFPKRVKAVVVHKKYIVSNTVMNVMDVNNICIEVTLLTNGGMELENYVRVLVAPGSVYKWCTSSKNSLVAHQF